MKKKKETKSFDTKEIFTYSDYLVDVMTNHIDRERQKKKFRKNFQQAGAFNSSIMCLFVYFNPNGEYLV